MSTLSLITIIYLIFLFFIGLILIFYKPRKEKIRIKQMDLLNHEMTLNDKIAIINGKNSGRRKNKLKNYFLDIQIILSKMNKLKDYGKLKLIAVACAAAGFVVSAAVNNYFLAIVLVPVFFILPFAMVKTRYRKFNKMLEGELETAISLVTISYTRTESLVTSVQECLETLPPNARMYFEDFLTEVNFINANIDTALVNLKTKVENRIFQQWVDRLIVCQKDRSAINSLQSFANEFADNRNIQNELDAEAYSAKVEMFMMIGFVCLAPVVLFFLQREAFNHLMHDTIGKITVFLSLAACIFVYAMGSKISKPIVFRGNKDDDE